MTFKLINEFREFIETKELGMNARTVVRVNSDNFENELFTFEAYTELRLQMSTGDFHTHTHEIVEVPADATVIELSDFLNEEGA